MCLDVIFKIKNKRLWMNQIVNTHRKTNICRLGLCVNFSPCLSWIFISVDYACVRLNEAHIGVRNIVEKKNKTRSVHFYRILNAQSILFTRANWNLIHIHIIVFSLFFVWFFSLHFLDMLLDNCVENFLVESNNVDIRRPLRVFNSI